MDLLAKRYASPFLILDEIVSRGRLRDFVEELNKELDEERLWEIWLHKVSVYSDNRSFDEWKNAVTVHHEENAPDLKATVTNSIEILDGFTP